MTRLEGEQTLMRIFIGENDRCGRQPLYQALVEMLRGEGFAGATVLKGAMGFGASSRMHSDKLLRFSADLPVVIEVVESQAKIDEVMPRIDALIGGGMITLERARVIRYAPDDQSGGGEEQGRC